MKTAIIKAGENHVVALSNYFGSMLPKPYGVTTFPLCPGKPDTYQITLHDDVGAFHIYSDINIKGEVAPEFKAYQFYVDGIEFWKVDVSRTTPRDVRHLLHQLLAGNFAKVDKFLFADWIEYDSDSDQEEDYLALQVGALDTTTKSGAFYPSASMESRPDKQIIASLERAGEKFNDFMENRPTCGPELDVYKALARGIPVKPPKSERAGVADLVPLDDDTISFRSTPDMLIEQLCLNQLEPIANSGEISYKGEAVDYNKLIEITKGGGRAYSFTLSVHGHVRYITIYWNALTSKPEVAHISRNPNASFQVGTGVDFGVVIHDEVHEPLIKGDQDCIAHGVELVQERIIERLRGRVSEAYKNSNYQEASKQLTPKPEFSLDFISQADVSGPKLTYSKDKVADNEYTVDELKESCNLGKVYRTNGVKITSAEIFNEAVMGTIIAINDARRKVKATISKHPTSDTIIITDVDKFDDGCNSD